MYALAGAEEDVSRVGFSPLRYKAEAMHGGEEEASQIRARRYSQVKHQEHEARRLVGIDESDWGKRQKGRETEMERSRYILKGLSTLRQQWAITGKEGEPKEAVGTPKASYTLRWSRARRKGAEG